MCSVTQLCPTFAMLWTVAHQAPLPTPFFRQEYWSGLPFPPWGDLPNSGIEPMSPALQIDSLPLSHQRSPIGSVSTLIFLHVDDQLFQHHLLKIYLFFFFWKDIFSPLSKIIFCWSVLGLCVIPLIYLSLLVPIPHCFDYCSFYSRFSSWVVSVFWLCSSRCVGYSGSFDFPYKFSISPSISTK